MPSHVHFVIDLSDSIAVSVFLRVIKRPFSYQALTWFAKNEPGLNEWLTVKLGKREVRRFWQEGGGYNRVIEDEEGLREVISYIHENPVRAGLVRSATDWKWSSARFYADGENGVVPIDSLEWLKRRDE
jgi:putative transposase